MLAIPALVTLLALVYVRPQEILPSLQGVPALHALVLLVVTGFALDVRLGFARLRASPLLGAAVLYFTWSTVSMLAVARHALAREGLLASVSFVLFLAISQAVQTFRGLRVIGATLLALSLLLAAVGAHQAFAPTGCVREDDYDPRILVPDGRSCEGRADCQPTVLDADARYRCEHLGLLGTTSIEGRVRYRGIVEDPNELALVTSVALPFAFLVYQGRRTLPGLLFAGAALGLVAVATVYTRSRSGQLAFLGVMAAYLFRRLRWRGAFGALVLAAPVVLLGGRSDAQASASAAERLECWRVALDLFARSPLFGVGPGQFTEHHPLTAHNALLLALAETGAVGLLLWTAVVYLAFKTTVLLLRRDPGPAGRVATLYAGALLASLCGLMISSTFLSFTGHNVLWIYLGAAGALAQAAARHLPGFAVRFRRLDALAVVLIDAAVVVASFVYTRVGFVPPAPGP